MKKIIYLIYLLPIIFLGFLFYQNTKPVLEMRCDVGGKTPFCGELLPTARVEAEKDGAVIKSEPVYFDARLPRRYDEAEAEIEYSDLAADIFEIGISRDAPRRAFDFWPLQNKILDNLAWQKIEGDDLILYQKKPLYKNIEEFKKKMPGFNETLIFRAEASPPVGALKGRGETIVDFSIIGGLKFFVYHRGGKLDINISSADEYQIRVYKNNKTIGHPGADSLEEGVYKVEISGAEDTVFDRLAVNSSSLAVIDKIKIGNLKKPIQIYLAGSRLLANAYRAEGLQTLDINGQKLKLASAREQYAAILKDIKLRPMEIPKGNVELNGALFFLNGRPFYPRYEPFYPGVNLDKVNFIIAKYGRPEGAAVKKAKAVFNIKDTPAFGGKLRFILSFPNAAKGNLVKIRSIRLKFSGEKYSINNIFQLLWRNILRTFSII